MATRPRTPAAACVVAALLLIGTTIARAETALPALRAHRLASPLTVDGRLDEEIYKVTEPFSSFVQQEPHEGEPVTEKTDVYVFFDDKNVYVSVRMWDSHPERIIGDELRRDGSNMTQNDTIALILDTFHDQRTGFLFITNPLGALQEGLVTSEKDYNGNWNGIWLPKASRFDQGWSVEIAIPFKTLRYRTTGEQTWGINLRRTVRWKNEISHLAPVPAAQALMAIMRLSEAATLTGVETPSSGRNVEVKPYGIWRTTTDTLSHPPKAHDPDADIGVDGKYGVTQGLTADFTVNTDFAQVEDDQQQVNLTRFGLFYPEKREFFLEGQGLFLFGGAGGDDTPTLFFSRRIGLAAGQAIPIQAGGRLTGKAGRTSIALLDIQTREFAGVNEPSTNFGVVRLRHDVFGRSSIGMIATQRLPDNADANVAYGLDGNFGFGLTTLATYYARTHTPGRAGEDDSYNLQAEYKGDRYGLAGQELGVGANFNPEIGFLRRSDFRKHYGMARFSPRPAHSAVVRKYTYQASLDYVTDLDNRLESRAGVASFITDFNNADQITASFARNYERLDQPFPITRSVTIPAGAYPFDTATAGYTLGPTRRVRGTATVNAGSFYDGTRRGLGYTGRISLTTRAAIEPTVSRDWVSLPWGSFTTDLIAARAVYNRSPQTSIAALVQYASSSRTLASNIRFQWEYRPGSNIFVVYNEGRDTEASGRLAPIQNRSFVVKATRLFQY